MVFQIYLQKNASIAQVLYILKLIANVNTRRTELLEMETTCGNEV